MLYGIIAVLMVSNTVSILTSFELWRLLKAALKREKNLNIALQESIRREHEIWNRCQNDSFLRRLGLGAAVW